MRGFLLASICLLGSGSWVWSQNSMALETVRAIKQATVCVKVPVGNEMAIGSGWVMKVEGETGYLVTNHHVVTGAPKPPGQEYPEVQVVFFSGTKQERTVKAQVLASQRQPDLAVLKVSGVKELPRPIDFHSSPELVETMSVLIFGFPFTGLDAGKNPPITVTRGSVSSIRIDGIVQLDTNLNPGNSGGPVVDIKGQLVGIAFARPETRGKDQLAITGIGLAIPSCELIKMLQGTIGDYAIESKKVYIGSADVEIRVRLIDPLEKIKKVAIHYIPADAVEGQKSLSSLAGIQKVELGVQKQQAVGILQVTTSRPGVTSFFCQASCVNGEGKTLLAHPLPFHVHFPKNISENKGDLIVLAREAHGSRIHDLAFSPDGKKLATCGDWDDMLKLWEVGDGWKSTSLKGHKKFVFSSVHSVAFSPDGKMLASASEYKGDIGIRVWDVVSAKELRRIDMSETGVRQVAFSPDGKTLAAGGHDNNVLFWEVASGKQLDSIKVPPKGEGDYRYPLDCLAFAPDGRTLATGGRDSMVRLWDLTAHMERMALVGHEKPVLSLAWTPDGKTLASASDDGTVKLWDGATGKLRATFSHKSHSVQAIAFNSDGRLLASASMEGIVRLWHVVEARELASLSHEGYSGSCVAFSPDDQFIVGRGGPRGSHVIVWRLARALEQKQGKK